ncbi:DNA helicase PIF1, ATP-dependent [Corchorus olitorius]|uniref:DNA helicase PIF1, ATP-dependent n=1 Tax=Corchorus olitorius TaxID=93759 RepID=A0A1R3HC94_9ROSI|nr:DNA helicase PIF1, ATP-dependent [Corchorus olitorius]
MAGTNHHKIGTLLPIAGQKPKFAQLYMIESDSEIQHRLQCLGNADDNYGLDPDIVRGLRDLLDEHNEIVKVFRHARDMHKEHEEVGYKIRLLSERNRMDRNYEPPKSDEIAAIIPGNVGYGDAGRDIIVQHREGRLERISDLHPLFMPLQYPLLFPYGEDSFHLQIPYQEGPARQRLGRQFLTMREYYAYLIQQRFPEKSTLLRGGRLFQQFIVDAYAIIEEARLRYIREHQKTLRAEMFREKRGLPHVHILLWLDRERPLAASEIDTIVSAKLPDKEKDPIGFAAVSTFMLHSPCGRANANAKCMKNGKCKKYFPKQFRNATVFDEDGFPHYRKRETSDSAVVDGFAVDNRFVVPHNVDLTVRYQAHINVEVCNQTRAVKYLFKYLSKGPDRARAAVERVDGAAVNEQVYFSDNQSLSSVLARPGIERTMFTEWFEANKRCEDAMRLFYVDFPTEWTWKATEKTWVPRQNRRSIGRIIYVHPSAGELYYMRLMLNEIRGATCYEDLRTVDGIVYDTFREACLAMDLLGDDSEWIRAMEEASQVQTGDQLRRLFVTLILNSAVGDPKSFFEKTWTLLAEDISFILRRSYGIEHFSVPPDHLRNQLLLLLEDGFRKHSTSLEEYNLPLPSRAATTNTGDRLLDEELNYDRVQLEIDYLSMLSSFNEEQRNVYMEIRESVDNGSGDGKISAFGSNDDREGDLIKIPHDLLVPISEDPISDVVSAVYPDFENNFADQRYISERAIVTPYNETVDSINEAVLAKIPAEEKIYRSADSISPSSSLAADQAQLYPKSNMSLKFISQLKPPGQNQIVKLRGDAIHVQISEALSEKNRGKLVEGAIHQLSRFRVQQAKGRNLSTMGNVIIAFQLNTQIKIIPDNAANYPRFYFQFRTLEMLTPYANSDKYMTDFVGALFSVSEIKTVTMAQDGRDVTKFDCLMLQPSGEQMRITVWESCFNQLDQKELLTMKPAPILLFEGLLPKTFNEWKIAEILYLSSCSGTRIHINPNLPDHIPLEQLDQIRPEGVILDQQGNVGPTLQARIEAAANIDIESLLQMEPSSIGVSFINRMFDTYMIEWRLFITRN